MSEPATDLDAGASFFAEATAVRPGGVEGQWDVELRPEFSIMPGRPNGGYLLAVLGRAALAAEGGEGRHVVGATATYVTPPTEGPATVRTEVLRRGRTASQVRTQLVQGDRTCVDVTMIVGAVGDEAPAWGDVPPVALPSEEECRAATLAGRVPRPDGLAPPLTEILQTVYDPATFGFASGVPGGGGELRAWMRLAGDRSFDPLSLLFAVDALPPATFEVATTGWVPTLSLTAYVRAVPAPGPLRVRFRVGAIVGGFVDETCDVWDSRDRLVAQSTQLAAIRLP